MLLKLAMYQLAGSSLRVGERPPRSGAASEVRSDLRVGERPPRSGAASKVRSGLRGRGVASEVKEWPPRSGSCLRGGGATSSEASSRLTPPATAYNKLMWSTDLAKTTSFHSSVRPKLTTSRRFQVASSKDLGSLVAQNFMSFISFV